MCENTGKRELTPKAILHQKYGSGVAYKTEEVKTFIEDACPGLAVSRQGRVLFRCCLELPGLSVTSDVFTKKKDAEQAAAKIAIEKLCICPNSDNHSVLDPWDALRKRLMYLFSDELLSSAHPLVGHLKVATQRVGNLRGLIPVSVLFICDSKINVLCRCINSKAEDMPSLMAAIIKKAATKCDSISASEEKPWLWRMDPHFLKMLEALIEQDENSKEAIHVEALYISNEMVKPVETFFLEIFPSMYYMDLIAHKLKAQDCSSISISSVVGKAKSEMRLYYLNREVPYIVSESTKEAPFHINASSSLESELNLRASYILGQKIYGDAVMLSIGYTWSSSGLFHENVSLSTYYRMLIGRLPDGDYKLSREAVFVAKLPTLFSSRTNWRGSLPRNLLCTFCRHHRLLEPVFSVKIVDSSATFSMHEKGEKIKSSSPDDFCLCARREITCAAGGTSNAFRCEVKILSRRQDIIAECSTEDSYQKEGDAVQSAALKILIWLNGVLSEPDMHAENLSSSGNAQGVYVHAQAFLREFVMSPLFNRYNCRSEKKCNSVEPRCLNHENGITCMKIDGPDSGIFPSPGSLACIYYAVYLLQGENCYRTEPLETNNDFEIEIGAGALIPQLEACVTQLTVNQLASFVIELPSEDLILSKAGLPGELLSLLSAGNCFLEYEVKLLSVAQPPEERMEQALFNPSLSKQRMEYALRYIQESNATSLVDFGCGSGSLLDSLLLHTTSLERIAGVDISEKSLCRAAKMLCARLSQYSEVNTEVMPVKYAVLYDGSILDFDSRLYGFDIATCLEVIEHMEEDQAHLFGDLVLSSFSPKIFIVSTPNYEYNGILQSMHVSNKKEAVDTCIDSQPFGYRNHDHKFEWTRGQFNNWASVLALRHGYSVEFGGVGGLADVEPGFASQIAVFHRETLPGKCQVYGDSSLCYKVLWEWNTAELGAICN